MCTPADEILRDSAFAKTAMWNELTTFSYWLWKFADLPDAETKGEVADLLVRILMDDDPAAESSEELENLSTYISMLAQFDAVWQRSEMEFDA